MAIFKYSSLATAMTVSTEQAAPSSSILPQKPYWTALKIVAVVLVAVVAISSVGVGFYYFALRPSQTSNLPCGNGATNYPSCNACASGQSLVNGSCYSNCTNGATNPPACNQFASCSNGANNPPYCNSYSPCNNGATNPPSCNQFPPCTNGATNPPACNQYPPCSNGANNPPACNQYPPCSNGAANPPACDVYSTTTTLSCTPSTIGVNYTFSQCQVYVSAGTIPTGNVEISCSPTKNGYCDASVAASSCASLAGISSTESQCGFQIQAHELSLTVYANYLGDSTHQSSSSSGFIFTVNPPPSTAKVSGKAKTVGFGTTASEINFIEKTTGTTYTAVISSGNYTITLNNFKTYTVTIYYTYVGGSSTCTAGTLDLQSYNGTLVVAWSC